MGAASKHDDEGPIVGINVTPLVDVMLVLLIIFIITAPMLVQGHEDNIKITRPDDLRLASLYLQAQLSQENKHHE